MALRTQKEDSCLDQLSKSCKTPENEYIYQFHLDQQYISSRLIPATKLSFPLLRDE